MKTLSCLVAVLQLAVLLQVLEVTGSSSSSNPLLVVLSGQGDRATINVQSRTGDISKAYPFSEGLSLACSWGNRSTRCRTIFIIQVDNDTYVILVPLINSVGVLELHLDGSELVMGEKVEPRLRTRSRDPLDCTILDIFMVDDRVVAPCVASDTLYSCEVMLNHTSLSSTAINCLRLDSFGRQLNESDYPYITNFVRFQVRQPRYYFAVRENLYQVDFASLDMRSIYDLGESRSECDRLQFVGDSRLYAYCGSAQAVKVNIGISSTPYTLNGTGIPYNCPDSAHVVTVTKDSLGTIQIGYGSSDVEPTDSSNYVDGFCYNNLFFLVDSLLGILVLDLNTGRLFSLMDSAQTSTLVLLDTASETADGRYVVAIKDEPFGDVILYNTESLRSSSSADDSIGWLVRKRKRAAAVGVLTGLEPSTPPPPTPPITPPTTASRNTLGIALGVGIPVLICIVLALLVSGVVCAVRRHKQSLRRRLEIQGNPPVVDPALPPRDVVGERDSQNEDDGVTPTDLPAAERDETPPNSRSRDNLGDGASQDEMDAAVMRPCQAGGRRHTGVPPPPQHNDQVHLMVPGTLASIQSQDSATSLASGAIQTSDSTTALLGNSTVQPTTATPAVAQSDNYPTTISAQPTTSTT